MYLSLTFALFITGTCLLQVNAGKFIARLVLKYETKRYETKHNFLIYSSAMEGQLLPYLCSLTTNMQVQTCKFKHAN